MLVYCLSSERREGKRREGAERRGAMAYLCEMDRRRGGEKKDGGAFNRIPVSPVFYGDKSGNPELKSKAIIANPEKLEICAKICVKAFRG